MRVEHFSRAQLLQIPQLMGVCPKQKGLIDMNKPVVSRRTLLRAAGAAIGAGLVSQLPRMAESAPMHALGNNLPLNPNYPIGFADPWNQNARQFATSVLRMPSGVTLPIYYGGLVRADVAGTQPLAGLWYAEWPQAGTTPAADSDASAAGIFREVSAHNHAYGMRNVTAAGNASYTLNAHRSANSSQIYYFYNEPETYTAATELFTGTGQVAFTQDPDAAACVGTFFDPPGSTLTDGQNKRIRAAALAKLFLRYKRQVELNSSTNVLLPPSSIWPSWGSSYLGGNNADMRAYWEAFYDFVHGYNGASVNSAPCGETAITPAQLGTLHTHGYPDTGLNTSDPLGAIAKGAVAMRLGTEWYRARYLANAALPMNYVLSETGPFWTLSGFRGKNAWLAGFDTLAKALVYYNTWWRWLSRNATSELNLASGKRVYALQYGATGRPFVVSAQNGSSSIDDAMGLVTGSRTQSYFNFPTLAMASESFKTANVVAISTVAVPNPVSSPGSVNTYQTGWTICPGTAGSTLTNEAGSDATSAKYWWSPFTAVLSVWSQVGGAAVNTGSQVSATSWTYDGATAGEKGSFALTLPAGWSTVYVPLAKTTNGSGSDITYEFRWVSGATSVLAGRLHLHSSVFQDPTTYGANSFFGYPNAQVISSAMLCPLLVKTNGVTNATLKVTRVSGAGQNMGVSIGPAVVRGGITCTWFANQ
jgi:hypothetical protein